MTDVQGKKWLITGAASGIGLATAFRAARQGAVLFLTDIQEARLEAVAAKITGAGGKVAYHRAADVADHDAVAAMASELHRGHGSVDLVANVAGISTWGPIEKLEHRHWRRLVDVDLMGPIHVMECFVPPMIEAGRGGHIVNVSSAAGLLGLPWHAAYSAAKFGLRGISEVLRFDLHRHGIRVTLVCPGAVDTPLVETVEMVGIDREAPAVRKLTADFRRRAVKAEDVAEAILEGVRRDRYLVFTSRDVRILFWLQRIAPPLYERVMRALNDRMTSVGRRSVRT